MSDDNCYRCDGTGTVCNICGESKPACGCSDVDIEEYVAEFQMSNMDSCPDCGGDND